MTRKTRRHNRLLLVAFLAVFGVPIVGLALVAHYVAGLA